MAIDWTADKSKTYSGYNDVILKIKPERRLWNAEQFGALAHYSQTAAEQYANNLRGVIGGKDEGGLQINFDNAVSAARAEECAASARVARARKTIGNRRRGVKFINPPAEYINKELYSDLCNRKFWFERLCEDLARREEAARLAKEQAERQAKEQAERERLEKERKEAAEAARKKQENAQAWWNAFSVFAAVAGGIVGIILTAALFNVWMANSPEVGFMPNVIKPIIVVAVALGLVVFAVVAGIKSRNKPTVIAASIVGFCVVSTVCAMLPLLITTTHNDYAYADKCLYKETYYTNSQNRNVFVYEFAKCSDKNAETVIIADSVNNRPVRYIRADAFNKCNNLKAVVIGKNVASIKFNTFSDVRSLQTVYYKGTPQEWDQIKIDAFNRYLTDAKRYYYSETKPEGGGDYWHYVKGKPTPWE